MTETTTINTANKEKSMLISKQLTSKQKSKLQDILCPSKPGGITAGKPVVAKVDTNPTFSNISVPVSANVPKSSFINTAPQKSSLFVFGNKNMRSKGLEGSNLKSELVLPNATLASNINASSQINPLISLGNIVASVGDATNEKTLKSAEKNVCLDRSSAGNKNIVSCTTGPTIKSIDSFNFSLAPQLAVPSTSVAIKSTPSLTASATSSQNVTLKNPVFPSFSLVGLTPVTGSSNLFGPKDSKQKEFVASNVEVQPVKTVTQGDKATEPPAALINVTNTSALSDLSNIVQKVPSLSQKLINSATNSSSNENLENQPFTIVSESTASPVKSGSPSLFRSLSLGISSPKELSTQKSIFGGNSGSNALSSDFNFESILSNQLKLGSVVSQKESDTANVATSSVETILTANASDSATKTSLNKSDSQQVSLPSLFGQLSTDKPVSSVAFGSATTSETASTAATVSNSVTTTSTTVSVPTATDIISTATISTPTVTTTTTASFSFKLPSTTTTSSIFDLKSTSFTSASTSIFGQNICSPTCFGQSVGNVFSQAASSIFCQNPSSPFGPPSTGTSLFAQVPLTTPFGQTSTSQVFGQLTFGQSSSTSGHQNTFGEPTSPPASSQVFGQVSSPEFSTFCSPSASNSFFGSATNAFGTKSPFDKSGCSLFGQSTTGVFGSTGGSIRGGNGNTSSIFGGNTSAGDPFQSSDSSKGQVSMLPAMGVPPGITLTPEQLPNSYDVQMFPLPSHQPMSWPGSVTPIVMCGSMPAEGQPYYTSPPPSQQSSPSQSESPSGLNKAADLNDVEFPLLLRAGGNSSDSDSSGEKVEKSDLPLDAKKQEEKQIKLERPASGTVGLRNRRFMCPFNCFLQILLGQRKFTVFCLEKKYNDCELLVDETSVFHELASLFCKAWYGYEGILSLDVLKERLDSAIDDFVNEQEEDISHVATSILNVLEEELKTNKEKSSWMKITDRLRRICLLTDYPDPINPNFIDIYCKGEVTHIETCTKCQRERRVSDSFYVFDLAVPDEKHAMLAQIIEERMKESEIVSMCTQCNENVNMKKKSVFTKIPDMFFINLQRLTYDNTLRKLLRTKIFIPFQLQLLQENEPCVVNLCGYVDRLGDEDGGHYTSTVKNVSALNWNFFNDTVWRSTEIKSLEFPDVVFLSFCK